MYTPEETEKAKACGCAACAKKYGVPRRHNEAPKGAHWTALCAAVGAGLLYAAVRIATDTQ